MEETKESNTTQEGCLNNYNSAKVVGLNPNEVICLRLLFTELWKVYSAKTHWCKGKTKFDILDSDAHLTSIKTYSRVHILCHFLNVFLSLV